jgi:DNA-binding transcriptional ArsR family regulator
MRQRIRIQSGHGPIDDLGARLRDCHTAEKIGLSQSAISHALRRLRMTFNDELLIRTPEGMTPTAYAASLASDLTQ